MVAIIGNATAPGDTISVSTCESSITTGSVSFSSVAFARATGTSSPTSTATIATSGSLAYDFASASSHGSSFMQGAHETFQNDSIVTRRP